MPDFITETRTFVGETGNGALGEWGGFTTGMVYELVIKRLGGLVWIELPPGLGLANWLVLGETIFEQRWIRQEAQAANSEQ